MQKQKRMNRDCLRLDTEWQPHHGSSDVWQTQGVLRDEAGVGYGFRMSVHRVRAGLESFCVINSALHHFASGKTSAGRWSIHHLDGEKDNLFIDADSIIFSDSAHLMLEKDALALRLRGAGFGLDLRMARTLPEVWFGEDGRMPLPTLGRRLKSLYNCALPGLSCVGRVYLADGSSNRVRGTASCERLWGAVPLRLAKTHWERFYLFLDYGDEISLTTFPYAGQYAALCMPRGVPPFALYDYLLEAVDFLEIDEWRFASAWRLSLPQYSHTTYYLSPLSEQFRLPAAHPVLGVYDADGMRLGYAFSELLPGARNEIDRIGLAMFFTET